MTTRHNIRFLHPRPLLFVVAMRVCIACMADRFQATRMKRVIISFIPNRITRYAKFDLDKVKNQLVLKS